VLVGSDSISNKEILGNEPYIDYNDILYYDTVFHIIQLKYSVTWLIKKIDITDLRFAVTLNGKILYRGNFIYKSAKLPSDEPVIILEENLDTIGTNKIRIYKQFPIHNSDGYDDLRYQPELNKFLKANNKAYGSLFDTKKPTGIEPGSGIEFYFIDGITSIEGITDFSKAYLLENNINLGNLKLEDAPFITDSQIAFYDSSQNIFCLREIVSFSNFSPEQIINKFYAITVDRTPAVIGGFYLTIYSTPSPYIHIFPDLPFQNPINKYILRLYPGNYIGNRACTIINSPNLIQRLIRDGKLKNNFII
jgi:hypothetical protein